MSEISQESVDDAMSRLPDSFKEPFGAFVTADIEDERMWRGALAHILVTQAVEIEALRKSNTALANLLADDLK